MDKVGSYELCMIVMHWKKLHVTTIHNAWIMLVHVGCYGNYDGYVAVLRTAAILSEVSEKCVQMDVH